MKRFLLKTLVYLSGVRFYSYYGSPDKLELVFHKEVRLKEHATEFKLFEHEKEEVFMRFGRGVKKNTKFYVISAEFSEEFSPEAKELNNLKFEINVKYCNMFSEEIVFDILFLNFLNFLNYVLKK